VNVELTDAQKELLDDMARRQGAPVEAVIARLVQDQLDYDTRFRNAVAEGIAAAERGETASHDDVAARAAARAARLAAR
jgi:predicted transcriptional regulator